MNRLFWLSERDGSTLRLSTCVAKERQEHIFESFSQADDSTTRLYGGTGLGLAISRRLVELMDGEIWLESEPGQGSCFFFTVQLKVAQPTVLPAEAAAADPLSPVFEYSAQKQVLVVEDNEINCELLSDLLSDVGIAVTIAHNGQQALEILVKQPFDAVLMDCQMPVMDGYEATRHIRQQPQWQELPVLALTASALPEDIDKALAAGMNAHIAKPIDPQRLFQILAGYLQPNRSEK